MQKLIIYAVVFLDIVGIGVLIPALPDLVTLYGTTEFLVTMGITIYGICSFISGPILGQWSDKYGRKGILLYCVIGTCLSYLVLFLTHNIWLYLIARAVNGITGGNIGILQSMIADISPDADQRRKNMGILGALFGVGFIV